MELRPGYKNTDIGVIPEDWEVVRLRDCFKITAGGDVDRSRFSAKQDSRFRFPIYANAITDRGLYGFADYAVSPANSFTITARGFLGHAEFRDHPYTAIVRLLVLVPTGAALASFVSSYINDRVTFAVESTGVPQLTAPQVGRYSIALPPLPEQKAIAEVLSDVDAAIGALSRLIAKKRDLRQGVMQRLLTGQTRLPGFAGPWREKRLGDHVAFLRNGIQSRAQLTLDDPVRYLHYGDIHVSTDLRLDVSKSNMPRLPSLAAARLTQLANGDVVFVDASEDLNGVGKSLEIIGAEGVEAVAGQHTIAARFDKSVLADGFKCYLQFIPSFATHLRRLAAGTKVYATNRKHIASAELQLPEPEEQTAIARVLSDMEREIAALNARLDKTRALKQAMMQALLTGRVRLPVPCEAVREIREAAYA
jgi:type I restriction enzyme S subunit